MYPLRKYPPAVPILCMQYAYSLTNFVETEKHFIYNSVVHSNPLYVPKHCLTSIPRQWHLHRHLNAAAIIIYLYLGVLKVLIIILAQKAECLGSFVPAQDGDWAVVIKLPKTDPRI